MHRVSFWTISECLNLLWWVLWSPHHSITSFCILHSLFSNVGIIIKKEWECSNFWSDIYLFSLSCIVQRRVTLHTLFSNLSSYEYKNMNTHSCTHLINLSSLKNVETIKPSWWYSEWNTTPLDKLQKMWQINEALRMTYREEESENPSGGPQQIQQQPSVSYYWY